ncbi:MAG: threonine--tRNA ligase [Candidatus Omnitrophica bacterium]|nr:threonine--tRNA ligase [Candidatus Omnitrophota bacterium]MCM8810541.1 threonine--tRNA ligase [Candidatus Omnitrophota bacterium]MCM8832828.1 threonine--tRNA ligase [Candidatus Omnitrophota bacterium]
MDYKKYWHTTSHIMAQAVKRLFPYVKLGTGPAIDKGFYYDFYKEEPFTPQDLIKIEEEMKKIIKENYKVEKIEKNKEEARQILKNEPFKLEILDEIKNEKVSFYKQGEFIDLCEGPHLDSTGEVKYFKLLSISSSYWKADENRESMQRIYGISFETKQELEEYIKFLEEAKQRDHRILGKKLDLFSINPEYGPGLIFWHPKGAIIRKIIEDFWKEIHLKNGYELVYTPHIANISLWEKSGHTSFYSDFLFPEMEVGEGKVYLLKPMNCPFHIQIYNSRLRSYKELPIRWAELGTVYRYEKPGVLHGLLRVRGFTQDDAHIFCTPNQLEQEICNIIDLVYFFLKSFGFEEYRVFLSTRPEKFVGTIENWEKATTSLENALKSKNINYEIDPGEGVFYGPKIDIKIKDCINREWQCSTIQIDFNIPEKFNLNYIDDKGKFKTPIMIHRAILGSLERFFGILIEHYKGNFPLWLAPEQVRILPVADRHNQFSINLKEKLKENFRVDVDLRNEKINKKIKDAEDEKVPYMIIIGDREIRENKLSLRKHTKGMLGEFNLDEIVKLFNEEIISKK